MQDFKTLPNNELNGGIQYHFKADNGYGASIIKSGYSYGGREGLYELAILDEEGSICYDTPLSDDVIGYLSDTEVNDMLDKISKL